QVGGDILLIHIGLGLVVNQDHDDVGRLGGLGHSHDVEAVGFGHGPGLAALAQAHDDVTAGISEVQRMGVALGTVTDDGNLLAVQLAQVAILLIIHFCHNRTLLFLWLLRRLYLYRVPAPPCRCAPARGYRALSRDPQWPRPCSPRRSWRGSASWVRRR